MPKITLAELAERSGVSVDAVRASLEYSGLIPVPEELTESQAETAKKNLVKGALIAWNRTLRRNTIVAESIAEGKPKKRPYVLLTLSKKREAKFFLLKIKDGREILKTLLGPVDKGWSFQYVPVTVDDFTNITENTVNKLTTLVEFKRACKKLTKGQ